MITFLLGMAVGAVIGWNLFPQPKWVLFAYQAARILIRSKFGKNL